MTDTITTDSFPRSERTRLVAEAAPDLIEALEKASQDYHRLEDGWQAEAARHQRDAGMPRRQLESPYGKALREASQAVVARFEELHAAKKQEEQGA